MALVSKYSSSPSRPHSRPVSVHVHVIYMIIWHRYARLEIAPGEFKRVLKMESLTISRVLETSEGCLEIGTRPVDANVPCVRACEANEHV